MENVVSTVTIERCEYEDLLAVKTKVKELEMLVKYYEHQLLLKVYLLRETVIHADETVHQVLREPGRAARMKSYEWIYQTSGCSEHRIAIYEYKETRSQEHPRAFLKDFKGILHTDGYQSYHNLPEGIMVIGCWSHVRRKFEDILKKTRKTSAKVPTRSVAWGT